MNAIEINESLIWHDVHRVSEKVYTTITARFTKARRGGSLNYLFSWIWRQIKHQDREESDSDTGDD